MEALLFESKNVKSSRNPSPSLLSVRIDTTHLSVGVAPGGRAGT
jgi:hypothetical protein